MFGYFRFFLASLVLLSHINIHIQGFNQGVSAVIAFYMLAGFVVRGLFSKVITSEKTIYLKFYYERILRIFPSYILITIVTLIFIFTTKFGNPYFSFITLVNNILIIPLNYSMFLDSSILQEPKWRLIPPAWSLGLELQAYLILPFIINSKLIKIILSVVSFCIFIMANLGIIDTLIFGYQLLPGVLFIFILGISIYNCSSEKITPDSFDKYYPIVIYVMIIFLLLILGFLETITRSFAMETMLGIIISMPIIMFLSKYNKKVPANSLLGNLSYGLFLSHFLAIWIVKHYSLIDPSVFPFYFVISIFSISLFFSFICVYCIEKNIAKYRFSLFKK